jgi:hypothetical protein
MNLARLGLAVLAAVAPSRPPASTQAAPFTPSWRRPPPTPAEMALKDRILRGVIAEARSGLRRCYGDASHEPSKSRGKIDGMIFIAFGLIASETGDEVTVRQVRVTRSEVGAALTACALRTVQHVSYKVRDADRRELASYPPGPFVTAPFSFPEDVSMPSGTPASADPAEGNAN